MSPRRLLVVTTGRVDSARLRERVREHAGSREAEVKVVAPTSHVSPLQWRASDENEAREEAEAVAREAKAAVEPEADVEAEVGDTDPVQAIEDALRTFPAEELIIATRSEEEAGWLEKDAADEALERFGLPVTRLVVDGG